MDSQAFELKRKKTALKPVAGRLESQSRLFKRSVSVHLNNRIEVKDGAIRKGGFGEIDERHRRPKREAVFNRKVDGLSFSHMSGNDEIFAGKRPSSIEK
jgi:hypothetical protein